MRILVGTDTRRSYDFCSCVGRTTPVVGRTTTFRRSDDCWSSVARLRTVIRLLIVGRTTPVRRSYDSWSSFVRYFTSRRERLHHNIRITIDHCNTSEETQYHKTNLQSLMKTYLIINYVLSTCMYNSVWYLAYTETAISTTNTIHPECCYSYLVL